MTTERHYLLLPAAFLRLFAVVALAMTLCAAQHLSDKDPAQWTVQDAQRILTASPWAQEASASFGNSSNEPKVPVGPMPDPSKGGRDGATDGRWDGGVGRYDRGGVPSLMVMVRWDSALPVRQALIKDQFRRLCCCAGAEGLRRHDIRLGAGWELSRRRTAGGAIYKRRGRFRHPGSGRNARRLDGNIQVVSQRQTYNCSGRCEAGFSNRRDSSFLSENAID